METQWTCEKCGATGKIKSAANASVYDVIEQLRQDHAATNPDCELDLTRIRVSTDQ